MPYSVSEQIEIGFYFFSLTKKKENTNVKTKNEVKNKFMRSWQEKDVFENEKIDKQAEKVTNHEEASPVVDDYEKIVRSKKKRILIAFREGRILERFKDSERFG